MYKPPSSFLSHAADSTTGRWVYYLPIQGSVRRTGAGATSNEQKLSHPERGVSHWGCLNYIWKMISENTITEGCVSCKQNFAIASGNFPIVFKNPRNQRKSAKLKKVKNHEFLAGNKTRRLRRLTQTNADSRRLTQTHADFTIKHADSRRLMRRLTQTHADFI